MRPRRWRPAGMWAVVVALLFMIVILVVIRASRSLGWGRFRCRVSVQQDATAGGDQRALVSVA